jgi:hypothetical protein
MRIDGKEKLKRVLHDAGYDSLVAAVAKHALFLHPDTVKQTTNKNLFRVVRAESSRRGQIVRYDSGPGDVLLDDNNSPANVFRWAIEDFSHDDVQFNHLYRDARTVEIYTSMANLCVTPAFLSKLTDTDVDVVAMLRYRAYDIYGFVPPGSPKPDKPAGYEKLVWHPFPAALVSVEGTFRKQMATKPKDRTTISAAQVGWLYSGFEPDGRLPVGRTKRAA